MFFYFYVYLILLLFFRPKKISDSKMLDFKSKRANKLAKKYLSEAKNNLDKKDVFYISLEKALHNFLKSKLAIETSEYSKERIYNLLSERNINNKTLSSFLKLIENCELARYTPASEVAVNNDYENAVNVISEIDKIL